MAETPGKPGAKRPSSSSRQVPAVKPGSSTRIRTSNTPKRPMPAHPEPESEGPELVSSGEDRDVSQVRRKVGSVPLAPAGLSLRWKIVLGMAGITIVTAVLIFVVVYTKAVGQLNSEIDAKGVRIVKTLSTIDAAYWRYAIMQPPEDVSRKRVDQLLQRLTDVKINEVTKQKFFQENPEFKPVYDAMVLPLGSELKPLKAGKSDVGPGSDILQITVVDDTEKGSVQAVPDYGQKGLSLSERRTDPSGVQISDGRDNQSGEEIRLFKMQRDTPPLGRFTFNVILSLAHINDAKASLRAFVLLPIFVSILLGMGIAIWISTLITEPIKTLMADITEVSAGNLEHQTAVTSTDEVGLLASTFNRMTQALKGAHDQELQTKALEHDLAIASEIQSNLVPKRMLKIPGYDISAYYRPSKEVGGDYYDFIEIDEHNEGIIVADVSGKGIPGSLVMTMARAFIRMEAERARNTSPGDTLGKANRMLAQDIKKGMFVTALYCILDKRTNEMKVASAGHNPMVVWRAATNQIQLVNPNGIALGFDKGPVFERTVKEEKIVLGRGDRIVLYTDGTVEAMNAANQEFGDDKFFGLVKQLATRDSNQMLNLLVKSLDEHKGNAPQSDDITIVTLRYL